MRPPGRGMASLRRGPHERFPQEDHSSQIRRCSREADPANSRLFYINVTPMSWRRSSGSAWSWSSVQAARSGLAPNVGLMDEGPAHQATPLEMAADGLAHVSRDRDRSGDDRGAYLLSPALSPDGRCERQTRSPRLPAPRGGWRRRALHLGTRSPNEADWPCAPFGHYAAHHCHRRWHGRPRDGTGACGEGTRRHGPRSAYATGRPGVHDTGAVRRWALRRGRGHAGVRFPRACAAVHPRVRP